MLETKISPLETSCVNCFGAVIASNPLSWQDREISVCVVQFFIRIFLEQLRFTEKFNRK